MVALLFLPRGNLTLICYFVTIMTFIVMFSINLITLLLTTTNEQCGPFIFVNQG